MDYFLSPPPPQWVCVSDLLYIAGISRSPPPCPWEAELREAGPFLWPHCHQVCSAPAVSLRCPSPQRMYMCTHAQPHTRHPQLPAGLRVLEGVPEQPTSPVQRSNNNSITSSPESDSCLPFCLTLKIPLQKEKQRLFYK